MSRSVNKTGVLLACLFAAWAMPALADPEEGEPAEYLYRNYMPIDADQKIKNCWDATYLARMRTASETLNGIYESANCLENAIMKASEEMFSDSFLQDPSKDFRKQLADIRKPYMRLMADIGQHHQGCTPYCGTDMDSYAIGSYASLLEDILRDMEKMQKIKPPRVKNPEYEEWVRRGRPFWPPQ